MNPASQQLVLSQYRSWIVGNSVHDIPQQESGHEECGGAFLKHLKGANKAPIAECEQVAHECGVSGDVPCENLTAKE